MTRTNNVFDEPLRLPPGYWLQEDPDILTLRREDGTVVVYFSTWGVTRESIEEAAEEDHRG